MEEKNSEKKERKMRDSGIPWIGEVPEGWKVDKIKYLFSSGKGLSITKAALLEEGLPVISYGQIHAKQNNGVTIKPELLRYTDFKYQKSNPSCIVNKYDFVFADTSEDYDGCGNCVYKRDDSLLFGGYHVVILHSLLNQDNRFYAYLFKSDEWRKQIRENASGVKVFSITQKNIMNASIICPPFEVQQQIADFLDSKCSEIDALIENLRARMESVKEYKKAVITEAVTKGLDKDAKMKDSGVEWIGEIPENWSNSRIKYEIIPLQRPVKNNDLIVTCFRDGTVTTRQNRREEGFTISLTENGYQGVNIGDLVIHGMDAFAGAIGCSDSRGKITPVVHVCKTMGNNRFFMFLLRSMAMNDVLMSYSDGVRIRSSDYRNFNKLGKFSIAVPPVNEQSQIADYLDSKCSEIDALLQNYEDQIATLEEYKKSLIYEYVTGKKEVPAV